MQEPQLQFTFCGCTRKSSVQLKPLIHADTGSEQIKIQHDLTHLLKKNNGTKRNLLGQMDGNGIFCLNVLQNTPFASYKHHRGTPHLVPRHGEGSTATQYGPTGVASQLH